MKRSGMFNKLTKKVQNKMNSYIPEKVHQIITDSMKHMVKTTLVGSDWTTKKQVEIIGGLYEQDELLKEKHNAYRKTGVIEGAGTGAGGIFLGAYANYNLMDQLAERAMNVYRMRILNAGFPLDD